jgi:hypothetical protein
MAIWRAQIMFGHLTYVAIPGAESRHARLRQLYITGGASQPVQSLLGAAMTIFGVNYQELTTFIVMKFANASSVCPRRASSRASLNAVTSAIVPPPRQQRTTETLRVPPSSDRTL